jgi:hypothetical protein
MGRSRVFGIFHDAVQILNQNLQKIQNFEIFIETLTVLKIVP